MVMWPTIWKCFDDVKEPGAIFKPSPNLEVARAMTRPRGVAAGWLGSGGQRDGSIIVVIFFSYRYYYINCNT